MSTDHLYNIIPSNGATHIDDPLPLILLLKHAHGVCTILSKLQFPESL